VRDMCKLSRSPLFEMYIFPL